MVKHCALLILALGLSISFPDLIMISDALSAPAIRAANAGGIRATNRAIDSWLGQDVHVAYGQAFVLLQQAVAHHQVAVVADMVQYPLRVVIPNRKDGSADTIRTREEFIRQYDRLFTPTIEGIVTRQRYTDLAVSETGVRFENDVVRLYGSCGEKRCQQKDIRIVDLRTPTIGHSR